VNNNRSAVWGGATIGLVVGLILGFFVGTYWMTVLYAVGIGAAVGVVANILGWLSDRGRNRAATPQVMSDYARQSLLGSVEAVLREHSPADFETTPNAAVECVDVVCSVEEEEWWRAGYDSLDSFYAAHEARHPDIRLYAAVRRETPIITAFADYESQYESEWPEALGEMIAQRIAVHRAQSR
jgi:hypothetical protein